MYIQSIDSVSHRIGNGLLFDDLDQVADAIQVLGELNRDCARPDEIENLIRTMRASITYNVTRSAFVDALTRGLPRDQWGKIEGNVTVLYGGYVLGGKFFVHNSSGMTRHHPFPDMEVRVNTLQPQDSDGPERYQLIVTDMLADRGPSLPDISKNHSESLLAAQLGRPRPIHTVSVKVEYQQDGPNVEFDFVPLLRALKSIDGMEPIGIAAFELACCYYNIEVASNGVGFVDMLDKRPDFRHASGARLRLNAVRGIESYTTGTLLASRLVQFDNTTVYGSPSTYCTPYVSFSIGGDENTSSEDLTALAEALTDALWANQY